MIVAIPLAPLPKVNSSVFCCIFTYFCLAVDTPIEEVIVAESSNITGDRGNPAYTKELNQLNDIKQSPEGNIIWRSHHIIVIREITANI